MKPKSIRILREKFETCGWRRMELLKLEVVFEDGTSSRVNVSISADQGTDGDVRLLIHDANTLLEFSRVLKRGKKLLEDEP